MKLVLITALGVGGATVIGALVGFIFKKESHKFSDIVLSFAAGVMLAAAILGLIMPSLEYGGKSGIITTIAGIFVGAICLNLIDKLVPHLHKMAGTDIESHNNANLNKVLLFVIAIAIHNIPEGLSVGVAYGANEFNAASLASALVLTMGIGLQNFPEGSALSMPIRAEGASKWRAFQLGQASALVEIVGAALGALLVSQVTVILPYALAFAAGAMIYVVISELIPESQSNKKKEVMAIFTIIGFSIMMLLDVALG